MASAFSETKDQRPLVGAPKTVPGSSHVFAQEVVRADLAAIKNDRPLVIHVFIMRLGMSLVRLAPIAVPAPGVSVSRKAKLTFGMEPSGKPSRHL
jgi:hypothetical protein